MTAEAQAARVAAAEHELQSHRAELTRHSPETMAYRHTADRIANLERDSLRFKAGKLNARD
jgi:hypothetical protein